MLTVVSASPARRGSSTTPSVGLTRPAIERSSVDLPEPDRPSSPTISFSDRVRSTLSSTSRLAPCGLP